MNKLVEMIESVFFNVVLWILLIPKTWFRIVTRPMWAVNYIQEQLSKSQEEQFDGYMSPFLFFFVVGVLPLTFFFNSWVAVEVTRTQDLFYTTMLSQTWEVKFLATSIFASTGPLSVVTVLQNMQGGEVSKSKIRPSFFVHSYLFGAFFATSTLSLLIGGIFEHPRIGLGVASGFFYWLVYAEFVTVKEQANKNYKYVWKVLILSALLFFILMVSTETLLLIGLGGIPRWMWESFNQKP